jgi:predicted lipoprotein with Yx(FWY)xxD motif
MASTPTLRFLLVLAAAALLVVLVGGCGSDDEAAPTAAAPAETGGEEGEGVDEAAGQEQSSKPERSEPKPGTKIKAASSQFGDVLFDDDDQAIYIFDKETSSESECYGECAREWPPVLTEGRPKAKGAIVQSKLGTTKRDGGQMQVTYDRQPLYYYYDEGPTEVRCHNVPGFGGLWLALTPEGEPAPI